jgi:hypothetical protein
MHQAKFLRQQNMNRSLSRIRFGALNDFNYVFPLSHEIKIENKSL